MRQRDTEQAENKPPQRSKGITDSTAGRSPAKDGRRLRAEEQLTTIFVGNLPFEASERDLRSSFERFGHVASVRLPIDRSTGRARGIAFVAMPRLDDADEAIKRMNGATIGGRRLVVNEARDRAEPVVRPRDPFWDLF
jgi:RNA recognition motif-containing protein